ncbi:DNA mismatch repair endonuclease MutH [soil metagenome]
MKATPPQSTTELLQRAQNLAGLTLAELAARLNIPVPVNLLYAKGWVGQLLEGMLGASAGSKAEPDFPNLQIELKTIPINDENQPLESTYVCTTPLINISGLQWRQSVVYKKLAQVLWIPVEADASIPISQRRVGNGLLWSPNAQQEQLLRTDWEELMELIALGKVDSISARHGVVLQIRPKAANAKALCWGIGEKGQKVLTLPRGFYLRAKFTVEILRQNYW